VSALRSQPLLTASVETIQIHPQLLTHLADGRPPPPPPRGRRGSRFVPQIYGSRFVKTCPQQMAQTPLRECCVLGTEDGGLGLLIPIDEKMYLRMMLLQQLMNMALKISTLGLNPRDYRVFKSTHFRNPPKNVLDGAVLWRFPRLHPKLQEELAAAVGSTAYLIKENLREIDSLSAFF
jgi:hypothetical protein